jgi:hypothetical protein
MFERYFEYNQALLNAQYGVSEIIEHLQIRGEVREDFIRDLIVKRKRNLLVETGLLSDGQTQSPQCDIIIALNDAPITPIGQKVCLNVTDCKLVIEVKSNLTGQDMRLCNEKAARIKRMAGEAKPLYGIFCYKFNFQKNTLLRRFRYIYDAEIMQYSEDLSLQLDYSNIDFIVSISEEEESLENEDIKKQFFIIKNEITGGYSFFNDYPPIKHFWRLIDGL